MLNCANAEGNIYTRARATRAYVRTYARENTYIGTCIYTDALTNTYDNNNSNNNNYGDDDDDDNADDDDDGDDVTTNSKPYIVPRNLSS